MITKRELKEGVPELYDFLLSHNAVCNYIEAVSADWTDIDVIIQTGTPSKFSGMFIYDDTEDGADYWIHLSCRWHEHTGEVNV